MQSFGYKQDIINYGVVIHRYYEGVADDLGTLVFWDTVLSELYAKMPFPAFWKGLDIHIVDMDNPSLKEANERGEANLRDYSKDQGLQTAAGLYWHRDKLEIAVFSNWLHGVSNDTLQKEMVLQAAKVLVHEIGHHHERESGCGATTWLGKIITEQFDLYRPRKSHNRSEDWAEVYRALFGGKDTIGYFSDNKPYTPNPTLYTLMKSAYWLNINLISKHITDLKFNPGYVTWTEWQLETFWVWYIPITYLKKVGNFRLDNDWRCYKV